MAEKVHITNIKTGLQAEPPKRVYDKLKIRNPAKMADWVLTETLNITTEEITLPANDDTTVITEVDVGSDNIDLSYQESELEKKTNQELYDILLEEGRPVKPGIKKANLIKIILEKTKHG